MSLHSRILIQSTRDKFFGMQLGDTYIELDFKYRVESHERKVVVRDAFVACGKGTS